MSSKALLSALEKSIASAVREEVSRQMTPLKAEIARLEKIVMARGGAKGPRAKAGPKTGTRTAKSEKLTPRSIKKIRTDLGLSQADFAMLAGVTAVAVYFWESGRTKPRGASVDALVELRGMSPTQARKRLGKS